MSPYYLDKVTFIDYNVTMSRKLELDEAKILELHSRGMSIKKIAHELGVSYLPIWSRLNPKLASRRRDKLRTTRVGTTINGVRRQYKVNKRPRPDFCELCEWPISQVLHWHHWDDQHLEWGLWLCGACHSWVGRADRGYYERYINLRMAMGLILV